MDFFDPDQLQNYFRSRGFKPKDYFGQNFLIDKDVLEKIVDSAELKNSDTVLEVGPGLGVLTRELVKKAGRVVAVEKDNRLFEILRKTFGNVAEVFRPPQDGNLKVSATPRARVEIINEDILKFHLAENIIGSYKVVANIPYYLTSKLLQNFLECENPPTHMILMIQKEVGERIVALPGKLSLLGISVQIYSDPEIIYHVSKHSFWPVPKVDSVILKITTKNKFPEIKDKKLFFRILKAAFAGKRKQIHNTLANGLKLPKEDVLSLLSQSKIDPAIRPQDIDIPHWIMLYKEFSKLKN